MEKRVILLLTALFIGTSLLLAQGVPDRVIEAFKKGSSRELGRYLSEKVDLTIAGKSARADKTATEKAMGEFFVRHKVGSFTVSHRGKRDESEFVIGTLATADGTFRVNCFFRKAGTNYVIHQIRIEKTNE